MWTKAFRESRVLSMSHAHFLRGLSWFRKALTTEDPFDKFTAFWTSLEIVSSKFHPENENTKKGSKSRIWECFKVLWGSIDRWPIITGDKAWIDEICETRNAILHGSKSFDVSAVRPVILKLEKLEAVLHRFLSDWRDLRLDLILDDEAITQEYSLELFSDEFAH